MKWRLKVVSCIVVTVALSVVSAMPAQAALWWTGYKTCSNGYVKMLDSSTGPVQHYHEQDILWKLKSFPTSGIHSSAFFTGTVWNELRKDTSVSVQNFAYYCTS